MIVWKRRTVGLLLSIGSMAAFCGCQTAGSADPAHPQTAYERSENALNDPMHYHPDFQKSDTDISGGDIGHLDKAGMQRDLNDVFNP